MAEQEYFKKALGDFTFDAAAGSAIRHLADSGLTVKQIAKNLTFPVPEEKIGRIVWEHFIKTGRIRREEPGNGATSEEYTYITEYDTYGRKSFRRVKLSEHGGGKTIFRKVVFDVKTCGGLADYLTKKCAENGEEKSYLSCCFAENSKKDMTGIAKRNDREGLGFAEVLGVLGQRERDYLTGLPWEDGTVYHQLDRRMREIVVRLYEAGKYRGECWFVGSGERVEVG